MTIKIRRYKPKVCFGGTNIKTESHENVQATFIYTLRKQLGCLCDTYITTGNLSSALVYRLSTYWVTG